MRLFQLNMLFYIHESTGFYQTCDIRQRNVYPLPVTRTNRCCHPFIPWVW